MAMEYFITREKQLLGNRFDQLYTAVSAAAARGITVNTLRCTPQQFLHNSNLPLAPSPFCQSGFLVQDSDVKLGHHPYHHAGVFYVQEPSASAPAALLDVQPGMKVLDLCAAPGGKSSQLAAALQGEGLLVSNEIMPARAQVLKGNLERMGISNAVVVNDTPQRIAKSFAGWFDRVLVDTPCSGEGMFRKESQAVAQHNEGLVLQCAALGKEILDAAAQCLAPGGILVFSTCTFSPQEDEEQVGAFLARHPEFTLQDCGVSFGAPGEENRCGEYPLDVKKVRRIWPCHGGEGHFMAKMQKSTCDEAVQGFKPQKSGKPCKEWVEFAQKWFPQLEHRRIQVVQDSVLLLPTQALPPHKLHLLRAGVWAGSIQKGRFVPGHHLYTAFGTQCINREELTLSDPRTQSYLRGEEIEAHTASNGWCAVLVDGFPLGGGKVSGGRVKNHYPKALRNLK